MTSYGGLDAVLYFREFQGVLVFATLCPKFHSSVLIYRIRFGGLRWPEAKVYMLWPFDLFLKKT